MFLQLGGDSVTVINAVSSPENVVAVHENLFAYRLFHLRLRMSNFNGVNGFFNCVFTQISCLSVSLVTDGI